MNYPAHVAMIPDGNRTWAKEQWFPSIQWHIAWKNNTLSLIRHIFMTTPISTFTLWGLSTENLRKRSKEELDYLCQTFLLAMEEVGCILQELKVSFRRAGNPDWLPENVVAGLNDLQERTQVDSPKTFVACVNYWGRDEILRGIKKLSPEQIVWLTEEQFSDMLDFSDLPVVDLVIRTKWNVARRLSWFMSWWVWYAELFFSDLKFPAFDTTAFDEAVAWYSSVLHERNFWK